VKTVSRSDERQDCETLMISPLPEQSVSHTPSAIKVR